MKIILLFTFLFTFTLSFCQNFYIKSEIKVEGMPFVPAGLEKKMGTTITMYIKDNQMKVISTVYGMTQTQFYKSDEEKVSVTTLSSSDCVAGVFTKAELREDSLENDVYVTDVSVEKTKESKLILGYFCRKVMIRYKAANSENKGIAVENEMTLWVAKDIPMQRNADVNFEITKRNALTAAIQSLEGYALLTESNYQGMKSTTTVTEFNTREIKDDVFEIKPKLCKEPPLNLKEYKKLLLKRKRERERNTGIH